MLALFLSVKIFHNILFSWTSDSNLVKINEGEKQPTKTTDLRSAKSDISKKM